MARHRDVRAINIDEEYDGYYDSCYGHSVEEDFCISPQTEAQFLYNRAAQEKHSMSAFLDSSSPNALQEEIETEDNSCCLHSNSVSKVKESLNPVDKAKLQSCIELMQNVVGETISEGMLSRAAMENKFNVEKALNAVLSGYQPPKTKHIEKDQKFEKEEFCVLRKYKHFIHKYKKWVIHGDLNDFSIWFKLLREIINCHVGSSSHLAVSNILNAYFSLIYPSKSDLILQTLNLGSEEMGLLNDCAMHLNKIVNSFLHILIKNYCHVYNITDHHHQMCKELHLFITELNSKMKIEQNPYLTSVNCLILSSVKLLFMPFTTLLHSVIKICFTSLESIPSMTKSQQNQSKAVALIIFLHFMLIILKSLIRCLLSVGKVYRSLDCKTISKFSGEFCSAVLLMNLNCIISAFQMMLSWCGTVTNFFFSAGFFSTGSGQRISPLVHARLEKWLMDHLSLNFIPCKKHVKEPKDCSYFLSFCLPPFSIQCATKLFSFTLENHINFKVLMQQICKYYLKIEMGRVISKLCEECKLLYSCVKTYFYRLHNLWWKNNVRCRRMYKISENILYQFFMYLVSLHGNKFHFDSPIKKKRNYVLKNHKPSGLSKFSACKKCYFNMLLLSTLLEHQSEVICNQKDFKLHSNKTCFGPKPQLLDQSSCHLNGQKLCCPNLLTELRVFDHDFQTNVKLPSPLKNPINAKPSWKENLPQVQVNVSSNLDSKSSINMSSNAAVLHSDAADILLKNICCLPSSEDFSEESEYNSLFRIEKKDQIKSSHISLSELHSYSTSSSIKNLDSSLLKETLSFSKDLSLGSEGSSVFRIEEKDQIKSPCMSLPELHSYSNSNNIETLDPILGQQPTDVPSLLDLYLKEVKCQKQDVENEKCKSKIEHEDQNKSLTSSLSELCSYSNCNGNNNLDSTMKHHSSDLSVSDLNLKDVTCQKKDTLSNISLTDLYFNAIKTKSNIYKEQNLCNASKSDVCKDLNTGSLNTSNEKIGAVDIWLSEFTGAEDSATISNRSIQYHDAQNESFSSPNNLNFEFKMPTRDSKCGDMLRKASSCDNKKDLHVKENSIPNETNFSQDHNFLSTWFASSSERFLIDESNLEIMTNPESTAFIDLSLAFKAKNVNTSDYEFQMLSPRSDDEVINMNILNTNTLSSCEHLKNVASKVRYRASLFSKVLCCKSKDDCSVAIPSPPETLTEIAASIQYTKYFNFNTPSPDDQVAAKQKGAFGNAGFKSKSDLGPKLEVIEDEPEVIGRLIISNGKIKSVENVEKSVNQITFEKKSEKILTDCTEELLCHSGISEDLNGKVPPKSVKNEDLNVIAVDSTNRLKSRASGKNVVEAYNKERGGEKPLINLVVVGHVDAGKSTLMGHLLFRLGCVAKKAMHKYEQDSKKLGKASFMYAWVLDETSEERTRGITMDVAQSKFITPHRSVVLLDAPGHKDFIPNMITGAAQADVAVLVVDATRGEFETGFETGGQTREHTMLIRSLGVSQLAVAVNKLDNVNWDQGRYKEIVAKLSSFLKQAGFKEGDVQFVPCSGLTGENLTEPPKISELKSWYSSCCLVDVIDSFKPPERPVSKPFRMCISDVFKGMGSGFCVSGRIEAGYVQNGDRVLVMPAGEQAIIKGITIDDTSMQHSFAGDHVTMQLSGVDTNNMSSGSVVCDVTRPVKVSAKFQARLVVFNIDTPITKGFPVVLHSQSMSEQAVIKKLVSQLHRSSGQVIKKKPRCLLKNTSAVVELEVIRPICIELYKDFKDLGRFMLRSSGSTIAAGLITEIY